MSAQSQYYTTDAVGFVPVGVFVLLMLLFAVLGIVAHAAAL